MLGSLFLAKFLPERVYNAHIPKSSNKCIGDECFHSTHLAIAVIQLLSCLQPPPKLTVVFEIQIKQN